MYLTLLSPDNYLCVWRLRGDNLGQPMPYAFFIFIFFNKPSGVRGRAKGVM